MNRMFGPLGTPGDHFPQGRGRAAGPVAAPAPSTAGDRPFGLRFVRRLTGAVRGRAPRPRYSPARQIAVDPRTGRPWYRDLPGTGSKATTGPSPDGGPGIGNEEWTPDFVGELS